MLVLFWLLFVEFNAINYNIRKVISILYRKAMTIKKYTIIINNEIKMLFLIYQVKYLKQKETIKI